MRRSQLQFQHFEHIVVAVLKSFGMGSDGLVRLREDYGPEFDGYILAGFEAGLRWPEVSFDIRILFVEGKLSPSWLSCCSSVAIEHLLEAARVHKEIEEEGDGPLAKHYKEGGGPA